MDVNTEKKIKEIEDVYKKSKKKRKFSLLFYIIVAVLVATTIMSIYSFKKTEKELGLNDEGSHLRIK